VTAPVDAVIFDLGGVLIDWNPRHLYRKVFDLPADMETFLSQVCTPEWNATLDAGRPLDEAVASLSVAHPDQRELIAIYADRWEEMLGEADDGTVAVVDELRRRGVAIFALTNWSAETFPFAEERYPFLGWFEDIVVSGRERLIKPDPAIFELAVDRFRVDPPSTAFIDDSAANVVAADRAGLRGHHYTDASQLRRFLADLGALDRPA
jgi:2-haloacid dehalogenase